MSTEIKFLNGAYEDKVWEIWGGGGYIICTFYLQAIIRGISVCLYRSSVSFGFTRGMHSLCPSVDSNTPNSKGHTVKHDLATVIKQLKGKKRPFMYTKPDISNYCKLNDNKNWDNMDLREDSDCSCCWDKISSFRWM